MLQKSFSPSPFSTLQEREQLEKANDLLKKLGFKQDINKDSGRPDSNPGNKNGTG